MRSSGAKRRASRDWAAVRRYHGWITANSRASGGFVSSRFLDFCHSIVLVHAYSVLQAVLDQYKQERKFSAKGRELKTLMQASRRVLQWTDFRKVDDGRKKRNDIAHKGQFPPRSASWSYMKAIETELVNWRVIPKQAPW
jgi:hypothetical protein